MQKKVVHKIIRDKLAEIRLPLARNEATEWNENTRIQPRKRDKEANKR